MILRAIRTISTQLYCARFHAERNSCSVYAEKSFRNLIKSNRNQIVFNIFRLIWNQTDIHLVQNQSESGKYNLISGWYKKISKRFLCVRLGANDVLKLLPLTDLNCHSFTWAAESFSVQTITTFSLWIIFSVAIFFDTYLVSLL